MSRPRWREAIMAQFTKTAIIESFLRLLETRSIEKITVKDIVEDCGVNRKTFYYYFKDIYDLTESVFRYSLEEFARAHTQTATSQQIVLDFFDMIYDYKRVIMHVFNSPDSQIFENYLYEVLSKLVLASIREKLKDSGVTEGDIALMSDMLTMTFLGFVLKWFRNGMKADVRGTVDRMFAVMQGVTELMVDNAEKLNK